MAGSLLAAGRWGSSGHALGVAVPPRAAGPGDAPVADSLLDFGLWSLLPAVVALGLAYATGQVLPALFAGIVAGAVVLFLHSGAWEDLNFITVFLIPSLGSQKYAVILLVYLWFLGGILGLWQRTGAARHFAEQVGARVAKGPRSSKLFGWILGCVFHQGGTVSTVLAGTTIKPVADRHRVSHEELSYIVDSTASPVATVLPFNAWPLYVGGLVAGASLDGYVLIGTPDEGRDWFFSAIPFNFYAIIAVLLTLGLSLEVLPWSGRRMAAATRRARETGRLDAEGSRPLLGVVSESSEPLEGYPPGLIDFLLPLGVLLAVAILPLVFLGHSRINEAFLGATVTAVMVAKLKGMPLREVVAAFVEGCKSMTLGAIILGLAVTLATVSDRLHTAQVIIAGVEGWLPHWALPAALTGVCMVVSFSIGSSFGTYAVVFPIAVPLALKLGIVAAGLEGQAIASLATTHPEAWADILFYSKVCFGAVLGGSVFGDQCSPISDTTILSSMFTGCDLMDHVRTQLPLALLASALGALLSTAMALL